MCATTAPGWTSCCTGAPPGEAYNIGGGNEAVNLDVAQTILDRLGKPHTLLQHVGDRPGHDRRYALDTSKAEALGWEPRHDFSILLAETVDWYAGERRLVARDQVGRVRRVVPEELRRARVACGVIGREGVRA